MTEIKPFRAVHYNPDKIDDLSKVVCPPYDVISTKDQERFYNTHPYNFIQILLGMERPGDDEHNNKYTRAKKTFEEWLQKGIFVEDDKPAVYYYKQDYVVRGQKHSRMGFLAVMRLPEEGKSKIFPHENTHAHAKEDRLRLWRNIKANCSPIFVCFSDKDKVVQRIFDQEISVTPPLMHVVDADKVTHKLWRLDNEKLVGDIVATLYGQELFIADGHHRYETAMEYRRHIAKKGKIGENDGCNFVMTYFTNLDSKDLLILPIHRMIKNVNITTEFLEEHFRVDKIRVKDDLPVLLVKAGQNEHAFGVYKPDGMFLLRLKNKSLIDQYIQGGSSEFRHLDATILKGFVFDRLGVKSEDIVYTKDFDEAISKVDEKEMSASFLLNSVKIQQLKAIARNGERMPPKTTYFYPKALSGLTVYKVESS